MHAIPTTFADTNFRSRLEARWAAFFDLIGWKWTYEPLDAEGYIPDFLIHGEQPFFIEVGPCITREDYLRKAEKPDRAAGSLGHDVLVVGVSPFIEEFAGLMGQFYADQPEEEPGFWWEPGSWSSCAECGQPGVVHSLGTYTVRPCSHYPGGHINGYSGPDVERLWREAGNTVQWMSARP